MLTKEQFHPDNLTQDDLIAFSKRYKYAPVLFCQEILLVEPDDNQVEILNAALNNDYLAVASGRGIGKSWVLGMIALWRLACWPGAKVLLFSNTSDQAKKTLWPPLIALLRKSLITDWFFSSSEMVHFHGEPELAFISRVSWSENTIESVSGYHSPNMWYLCDEASALPTPLLDNLYHSCTETNNGMVLTSNPTRNSGWYYDRWGNKRWVTMSIDSRSSRFTDKDKIQDLIDQYGEDSDTVRVQVRGLFPLQSSSTILSTEELERSTTGTPPEDNSAQVVSIGLDIGGGGDPTVWCIRRGNKVVAWEEAFTETEGPLIQRTTEICAKYQPHYLIYDKTGLGHFLGTPLAAVIPKHTTLIGRNFGTDSPQPDCFNTRAWLYRRLRDWVRDGGHIGRDVKVKEDLRATEYVYDDKGRIKLISKDKIREALGRSPDRSDALALSCGYSGSLVMPPAGGGAKMQGRNIAAAMMQASGWSG